MAEDYDFLTDVTVGKVYEGKSGESQYGKWTAYNFYVNGDNRKFSYFKTEKSPILPINGMRFKLLRFETVTKDGYTNHNVKEMFLYKKQTESTIDKMVNGNAPQAKPEALQSTISKNKDNDIGPMTMWGKYIGDIIGALIGEGLINEGLDDAAKAAMETFVDCCLIFEKTYSGVIELPTPKNNLDEVYNEPQTFADGTPVPEEPPF